MSIKNKAKDRNHQGRIWRKYTSPEPCGFPNHTPRWWVQMFMTRPRRRLNKAACAKIVRGTDPEGMTFPLGNRKPHHYYW